MNGTLIQQRADRRWFVTLVPSAAIVSLWWWLDAEEASSVFLPIATGVVVGFFAQLSDDGRVRWAGRGIALGVVLPFVLAFAFFIVVIGGD